MQRTQVAIIGAGPAGLFLAHMLHQAGIEAVVLERRDYPYVQARVRAGVLERVTVDLMDQLGVGARMRREGLVHDGINLSVDGQLFRIDLRELTGGSTVMIYGQSEVIKDLNEAATARGMTVIHEAQDVAVHGLDGPTPTVTWVQGGEPRQLSCDFVAGCDGSHGVSRECMPPAVVIPYERLFPFGWLGVLADVPPCNPELIYANHERGFTLASMRSATRSRYYIQCALDERVEDWPDERFWDEVCVRLGDDVAPHVIRGSSFDKSIAPLRSFVSEPMSWGRLFLAGDAAHIVPPTGAKGLNLAVADVILLASALREFYERGSERGLKGYSATALKRVWNSERFSWWFTGLTHRFPQMDRFDRRMQLAELDYIRKSRAAQLTLAENYLGLALAAG